MLQIRQNGQQSNESPEQVVFCQNKAFQKCSASNGLTIIQYTVELGIINKKIKIIKK